MKPVISDTGFGYITIEGSKIEHDIIIRLSGEIKKRKKKLSKAVYGTSHTVSLEETVDYFKKKKCGVDLQPVYVEQHLVKVSPVSVKGNFT